MEGRKFKLISKEPDETGAVESDVIYLPDFEQLLKSINKTLDVADGIVATDQVRGDRKFIDFSQKLRNLRNDIRTHLRKNYPEDYVDIKGIDETGFAVGAGPQFATPFAFKKTKKQDLPESNPGADLGPGPKAGKDGVTNNYYVSNFKYKIVNPKKLAAQSKAIDTKYLWGTKYV